MRPPTTERLQQIAAMYLEHDDALHRVVYRRGSHHADIVDDACQHAWTQLLLAHDVDLQPPRWSALAWLTTCAVREAWRLNDHAARASSLDASPTEVAGGPDTQDIAAARLRLALVKQLPERQRRFLLRLALGYSYREIAAAENVSYTTTNKQIAKAKRLLRELAHDAP